MNFRVRMKFARVQTGFSKKDSADTAQTPKAPLSNEANIAMVIYFRR
jgi:hypothetical protein